MGFSNTKLFGLENLPLLVSEDINNIDPFYEDGVHYSYRTGLHIAQCLVYQCNGDIKLTLLTTESIASYLEDVDLIMKSYPKTHPTEYKMLLKWLDI
jgi:hypothetical protein